MKNHTERKGVWSFYLAVTTGSARIVLSILHNPEANYLTVSLSAVEKRAC